MVRDRCDSCWNSCSLLRSSEQPRGLTSLYSRCTQSYGTAGVTEGGSLLRHNVYSLSK
jgi:hypothetical protein